MAKVKRPKSIARPRVKRVTGKGKSIYKRSK